MLPLEAEVVEREVVALCTERSEAIARFLESQATLDVAVAALLRPSPAASAGPAPDATPVASDERVERLRGEIAGLRARISRLEGEPERPETGPALAALRDELAEAVADLASIEGSGTDAVAAAPADAVPVPSEETADPTAPDPVASLPPPGTEPPGAAPAIAAEAPPAEPRSGPTEWRVIHAVRAEGGPWRVRLQASREISLPVPAPSVADEDGGTAAVTETLWRTVVESDPPFTATVGEILPDGMALRAVSAEGVEIGDPDDPDAAPATVPFGAADDFLPGAADWDFQVLGKDGS